MAKKEKLSVGQAIGSIFVGLLSLCILGFASYGVYTVIDNNVTASTEEKTEETPKDETVTTPEDDETTEDETVTTEAAVIANYDEAIEEACA